ncbi:MAG: type I restriction enzyme HsdR N-terminal domain-containing protein [Bacteroidetes bacterium]|nr:type I restriction enzyme HsdR N-terminal domain-containing protein [Bacteroidota bacterium]
MDELGAFPAYRFRTQERNGKPFILDEVRRKWVRLTPEEWVRQHLLRALADLGYPPGLTAVEKGFDFRGQTWRADVAVFDRHQTPLLLAECKAPDIPITEATFDQIARYNAVIQSPNLLVTNGHLLYFGIVEGDGVRFLDSIPPYAQIAGQ